MIIEYPKALYKNGQYISVADEKEEAQKREEGFMDWRADYDLMLAKASQYDEDEPEEEVTQQPKDKAALEAAVKRPKLVLKSA